MFQWYVRIVWVHVIFWSEELDLSDILPICFVHCDNRGDLVPLWIFSGCHHSVAERSTVLTTDAKARVY